VTRYDRRLHPHNAVNPGLPYASAVEIASRSERSLFELETSFDLHISDTLWSFAIASNEDIQGRTFVNVETGGRAVTTFSTDSFILGSTTGGLRMRKVGGRSPSLAFVMRGCWVTRSCFVSRGQMNRFVFDRCGNDVVLMVDVG